MEIILFFIMLIVFIFWTILGLIIWIPLLFRTIAVYSFSIAYSSISDPPIQYIKKNERNVKEAVRFYQKGFMTIYHLWQNRTKEGSQELEEIKNAEKEYKTNSSSQLKKFVLEVIWTIIFWILIIILF